MTENLNIRETMAKATSTLRALPNKNAITYWLIGKVAVLSRREVRTSSAFAAEVLTMVSEHLNERADELDARTAEAGR